jgi:energy-converting hydrogenase Eha subunit B
MAKATTSKELFRKVLVQSAFLTAVIALLSSVLGGVFAGQSGLISGLIGALMTLIFSSLTVLSVWFGGRLSLGGFFAVVLGGWVLKLIIFIAIVATLKGAEFINGPVLFFSLVASILSTLTLEALTVLRSRIPLIEN